MIDEKDLIVIKRFWRAMVTGLSGSNKSDKRQTVVTHKELNKAIETENYIIETPETCFEISTDNGKLALLEWLEKLKEQNKEFVCRLPGGSVLLKKSSLTCRVASIPLTLDEIVELEKS